jgi:carboxymethylenebutenolidase
MLINKKLNMLMTKSGKSSSGRRKFIGKLLKITGSVFVGGSLLNLSGKGRLSAAEVDDLYTESITYPGKTGDVIAFLARPSKGDKFPAVIVIHENRALQPHIKEVTKRMAAEGFLAIAPDGLSPLGGTPEDESEAISKLRSLDYDDTTADFVAAVKYLETHPLSTGKVGCTGFCWGGGMTNRVAVNSPTLDAAVPYYGATPDPVDVPKIKAAIMAHYAGEDTRINAGIPAFEEALKKAGIDYKIYIYDGAQHGFNNDTGSRYDEKSAKLAWSRTISFFREKLG